MNHLPIRRRRLVAGAVAWSVTSRGQAAPDAPGALRFPLRPVHLIVPLPAGSISDVQGRQLARQLEEVWGRPVVVENRPGASNIVGHDAGARAAPDGHTLLLATIGPLALLPHLMKLPFDPLADFAPVTRVSSGPMVLVAHPGAPFDSVDTMVRHSRAHPGQIKVAGFGIGTIGHLAVLLTAKVTGADLGHVPYAGGPQQVADLVGGQVPLLFDFSPVIAPHIRAGKARALAVTGERRLPDLPEVPTFGELGYPGLHITAWQGIVVPARTPPDIVRRLHADLATALAAPALRDAFAAVGAEIGGEPPEVFAAFVRAEHARWGRVIAEARIRLE